MVAINAFPDDHDSEHEVIRRFAAQRGVRVAVTRHVAQGGAGATDLVTQVLDATEEETHLRYTYELTDSLTDKLHKLATKVYGADGVELAPAAAADLRRFTDLGYGELPVLVAKTHLSTTATPADRGAPTGWTLPIREVRLAAGAGYVYALSGQMQTMPGLGSHPAAERMDLDADGRIVGLF